MTKIITEKNKISNDLKKYIQKEAIEWLLLQGNEFKNEDSAVIEFANLVNKYLKNRAKEKFNIDLF